MSIESPPAVGEDWNEVPVTAVLEPTPNFAEVPKPNPVDFVKRQSPSPMSLARPPKKPIDPDQFLLQAKAIVVANYNEHRDPKLTKAITMETTYIVWFVKTPRGWQVVVGSTTARGLRWDVSFNEDDKIASIAVYKKFTHTRISLG